MTRVNRFAGLLVGLLLLALGLLVVVEAVAISVWGRSWPIKPLLSWRDTLMDTPWSDWRVWVSGLIAFVVGVIILIAELWPVRPATLGTSGGGDWMLARRSVEKQAATAAESIRGVASAKAVTRGRPGRWRLRVIARTEGDVVDPRDVESVVQDQLRALGAPEQAPLQVAVRRR
jgi:hypothetical protein